MIAHKAVCQTLSKAFLKLKRCLINWTRLVLMLYFVYDCPQSCMSNPVERLLEVYEDVVEVLLLLEIFFTENS